MKIWIMAVVIGLATLSTLAKADQYVVLPGGGGCFVNSSGFAYGCDISPTDVKESQSTSRSRLGVKKLQMLQDCLRTANWPGKPDADQCQKMYGN